MKKNDPEDMVSRSRLHARQYQHVDGTFELTFGGASLLMAVSYYVTGKIASSNSLLPFVPLVVFVGGVYLLDFLVQQLRMRFTYPRTGFINYLKAQPLKRSIRLIIWIGIPVLTMLLLALILLNRPMFHAESQNYASTLIPSFTGLLFSGLWVMIGWMVSLPRFFLTSVVSLLVGVGIFIYGVGDNAGMALLFGAMGGALMVSGGLTLRQYLRINPLPQETADEQ
jgi:hypothetical protein